VIRIYESVIRIYESVIRIYESRSSTDVIAALIPSMPASFIPLDDSHLRIAASMDVIATLIQSLRVSCDVTAHA
jgi:hypothetical protein